MASAATIQLTGSYSALSDSSTPSHVANISNSGTVQLVGTTNQLVGTITSSAGTDANGTTVYSGNTTVGDGTNAANLTASQVLQNSLTSPPIRL